MDQNTFMREIEKMAGQDVCLAFSGGVDSSVLLKLLCDASGRLEHGGRIYAVTFQTRLHPSADVKIAGRVAAETGAVHCILPVDESENEELLNNPVNRCYLCKKYLFGRLIAFGQDKGVSLFLDGTNADDLNVYRPGLKALKELGIRSPLAEFGVTKADVRQMAGQMGLSVAFRPSAPCLATRIPYGTTMDFDLFKKIDQAEIFLKELGYPVVRVRVHGEIARLEVPADRLSDLAANSGAVVKKLKELGFSFIAMDLEGFRSGSMDRNL